MQLLETILEKMSSVSKTQKNFIHLIAELDELSRQSDLCQSESL